MDYTLKNGSLVVNGKEVVFPFPASESIFLKNKLIVCLKPKVGEVLNRNVFCVDDKGEIVWQIEESPHGGVKEKPYISIYLSNNTPVAKNWIGVDYYIDIDDGSISVKSFNRFT